MARGKLSRQKTLRYFAWGMGVLIVVVAGFLIGDYVYQEKHFGKHAYIERVDVSDLSQEEAAALLAETSIEESSKFPIILRAGSDRFAFSPGEIGLEVDPNLTAERALMSLRRVSYFHKLKGLARREGLIFPLFFRVDSNTIANFLEHFEAIINRPPQDATIIFLKGGGYHLQAEKSGRKLFIEESRKIMEDALRNGKRDISLQVEFKPARITKSMLAGHPPVNLLSSFTTFYGTHDSPNRIHNIQLIASWINNTLLLSGESFSLLSKTGDFSEERGFKEAFVILDGELVPQYGGGTCQIGTTLFNTASLADLDIKQRRNHSFYFNIYPLGRDATVYPPTLDLKFENNTGHPLLITSKATNKSLNFRIYGTLTGKKVTFSSPAVYMLGSAGRFVPSSLRRVIDEDRPFRTEVVRTVKDTSGKLLEKELIRSYYKLYGERDNVPIRRKEPR